jgi:hypothetical protein
VSASRRLSNSSQEETELEAESEFWSDPGFKCSVVCQHGGYCDYVHSESGDDRSAYSVEEFARLIQSGKMIQTCICPPGFDGTGCERVNTGECSLDEDGSDHICARNGVPCVENPLRPGDHRVRSQENWLNELFVLTTFRDMVCILHLRVKKCDCAIADRVSAFAGMVSSCSLIADRKFQ